MCLGSTPSAPPPVEQTAPKVTPPVSTPDTQISGMDASAQMKRRAAVAANLSKNLFTNPLGSTSTAATSRTNILG